MAAVDEDIRADFLAEAGDLIERLGGQLVELESRPNDQQLLNAIFRAFHTVKGGAGFLNATALVEVCHSAEDIFNALRNGKRQVDASLMDAIMQALDQVQAMMASIAARQEPASAPEALLKSLKAIASGKAPEAAKPKSEPKPEPKAVAKPAAAVAADPNLITEDEFDALLDQLDTVRKKAAPISTPASAPAADPNLISEAEFDALLDKLDAEKKQAVAPADPEHITETEFDALLDQLHAEKKQAKSSSPPAEEGLGKGGAAPQPTSPSPSAALPQGVRGAIAAPPPAAPAETTVRVDTVKLDKMMNLVGELVLVRNRLKSLRAAGGETLGRAISQLDFITRALQGAVMQTRMQPIGKVFSRFPKVARDTARGLGKQVEVVMTGQETDLDKNLVEALADPLVHMVRNSVDHGIELPELRAKAGKPAAGRLELAAQQAGDHILITVRDDGAGMDPERLKAKAIQKGLIDSASAARMSTEEALQLIFAPGFSTKEQVSDLSGRGVGMDVVKTAITRLNGSVSIESKVGQGSAIRIRVPLTLAILPALMVQVGDRQFALPLAAVHDVFALDESKLRKLNHWDVLPLKKETLRLVHLKNWTGARDIEEKGPRHVVVAHVGDERYGFIVSHVRGREEVVIKPLGKRLQGLAGIAGATVTPEGRVALILEFNGLVTAYARSLGI